MFLVKCKECGNEIDEDSFFCSYCGKEHKKALSIINTRKIKNHLIDALLIFFSILFLILSLGSFSEKLWLSGILFLAASTLPLLRKWLPSPFNTRKAFAIAMILLLFFSPVFLGLMLGIKEEKEGLVNTEAIKNEVTEKAKIEFKDNPEKVIKEISDLIDIKDFKYAKTRAERLLDTNNLKIQELYQLASSKIDEERKIQQQAQEEIQRAIQAQKSLQIKALDKCKQEISKYLNATGSIPDVQNFGSDNEFVYGWPRGTFQMTTVFGKVDLSASCDGSLKPLKVVSLSVNGRTVINAGKHVR